MNEDDLKKLFDYAYRAGWNNSKLPENTLDEDAYSYKAALEEFQNRARIHPSHRMRIVLEMVRELTGHKTMDGFTGALMCSIPGATREDDLMQLAVLTMTDERVAKPGTVEQLRLVGAGMAQILQENLHEGGVDPIEEH